MVPRQTMTPVTTNVQRSVQVPVVKYEQRTEMVPTTQTRLYYPAATPVVPVQPVAMAPAPRPMMSTYLAPVTSAVPLAPALQAVPAPVTQVPVAPQVAQYPGFLSQQIPVTAQPQAMQQQVPMQPAGQAPSQSGYLEPKSSSTNDSGTWVETRVMRDGKVIERTERRVDPNELQQQQQQQRRDTKLPGE